MSEIFRQPSNKTKSLPDVPHIEVNGYVPPVVTYAAAINNICTSLHCKMTR